MGRTISSGLAEMMMTRRPLRRMFIDEEQGFCVDERLRDVAEGLADELLDLVALPAGDQVKQFVSRSFELVLVRTEQEVHDLRQPHSRQTPCDRENPLCRAVCRTQASTTSR